jgi:hypothetical protein
LFVDIHLQPGHKYAGDVLVISLDNFMKPDSATLSGQRKVVIQRVKAAEVRFPMADEDFQFPLHDARANKRKESLKSALEVDDFAPDIEFPEPIEDEATLDSSSALLVDAESGGILMLHHLAYTNQTRIKFLINQKNSLQAIQTQKNQKLNLLKVIVM